MDEAKQTERLMSATLPLREGAPKLAVDPSISERDAATSVPSWACPMNGKQLATDQQKEQPVLEKLTLEQMTAKLERLQKRIHELETDSPVCPHCSTTSVQSEEKLEDAVSMPKSQTESDIEKQDQKHQSQLDEPENQQPPENGACRECRVKMAQIENLELELRDQEEKARRNEEAAIRHERSLANAHVIEVRKELSNRINKLEAQQSGQTSTSEDPEVQHRSTYYYCDHCCFLRMKLSKAREKIRDSEDKASCRKDQIRGLKYWLDEAREGSRVLREDLNAANEEIARLRASLGLRTSKL